MEKRKFILGAFFSLILSQLSFVLAASIFGQNSILGPIMQYVFGITGQTGSQVAVIFAVWLIFFVAASDIVSLFTMFSTFISWLIGFGLAIILVNTGATLKTAESMFGLAGMFGAIAIAFILIGAFIAALLFHFGVQWAERWLLRARVGRRAARGGAEIEEGARTMRGVGRVAEGART